MGLLLKISQDTLIKLPDGASGASVDIKRNGVTGGGIIGATDDRARIALVNGQLGKLTKLGSANPVEVVGSEPGAPKPATVSLLIYPEYPAGTDGPTGPFVITGMPIKTDEPDIWDLSNIDDASGGMDIVTAEERIALSALRAQVQTAGDYAQTQGDRVDVGLADITQRQALNNAQAAANGNKTPATSTAAIPATVGLYYITQGVDAAQVWERLAAPENGSTLKRRVEMEAVNLMGLHYVDAWAYGVRPGNTGAQNLAALQNLIDTVPLDTTIVVRPGVYKLGNTLFINRRIKLDVTGVTWLLEASFSGFSLYVHGPAMPAGRIRSETDRLLTQGPYYDQSLTGVRVIGWKVKSATGNMIGTAVMCVYLIGGEIDADVMDSDGNGVNLYHCRDVKVPDARAVNINNYGFFFFQSRGCRVERVYVQDAKRGLINKHAYNGTGVADNHADMVEMVDMQAELWMGGGANYEGVPGAQGVPPIYHDTYELAAGFTVGKMLIRRTKAAASPPQVTIARHTANWVIGELIIDGGGFDNLFLEQMPDGSWQWNPKSPLTIGSNGTAGGKDGENHIIKRLEFRNMNMKAQALIDYGVSFRVNEFVVRDSKISVILQDGNIKPFGTIKRVEIGALDIVCEQYLGASGTLGIRPQATTDMFVMNIRQLDLTPIENGANSAAQAMEILAKRCEITGGFTIRKGPATHTVTIGALLSGGGGRWLNATNTAANPGTLQMVNVKNTATGMYELEERHTNSTGNNAGFSIVINGKLHLLNPTRNGFAATYWSGDTTKLTGQAPPQVGAAAPVAADKARWIGDRFIDATNKKVYTAMAMTGAVSDWA